MKSTIALVSALAVAGALAQTLTAPAPGLWELRQQLEGGPSSTDRTTRTACLASNSLSAGPEGAMVAAAASGERQGPFCEIHNVQRESNRSTWEARCRGAMGEMRGQGKAAMAAETAQLEHSFAVKAPIVQLQLTQSIDARRLGECR